LEWSKALKESIEYIEDNLLSDLSSESLSKHVHISQFYFQKAFNIMSGYTLGEYIRNRRLYLAALDLIEKDAKVIDLAYRYGYETPESFSKSFRRFHGLSPMKLKKQPYRIKVFHPIEINVSIKGGTQLDYDIEEMDAFKIMGIGAQFSYETAFDEIPKYWKNWMEEKLSDCTIGKYGIIHDPMEGNYTFDYFIAGDYKEKYRLAHYNVLEIPALTWIKFHNTGPMPTSLQALNTRIFNEWLPKNKDYEISSEYNIEVYHLGDINDLNYKSEIWIPLKK